MSLSWKRRRRQEYMQFPETAFREAVYSLAKSLQAQGISIPQPLQEYVNYCDQVRREINRPDQQVGA